MQALCKHSAGPERLLEAYSLPGPQLAPGLQQQAVQVLAGTPGKLEAAWQLAAGLLNDSTAQQETAQLLVIVWRAAVMLPHDADSAQKVAGEVLGRVGGLDYSITAQLIVTSWEAPQPQRHLHQQLVAAVKQHTPITAHLLYTGWQGLGHFKQVQAWAIEEVLPILRVAMASPDAQERTAASALTNGLAEELLQSGQGNILLQQYTAWVKELELCLGKSSLLQLLQQAGISRALPVLMGGRAESHGKEDSTALLQALLESARTPDQSSQDITALLQAATQILRTIGRTLTHDIYTAALEATAFNADTLPMPALDLGQAALTRAVASGQKPGEDMAAACASLAEHSSVSAAWLEVLGTALSSSRPATALNWYSVVNQQLRKRTDNSLPVSPLLACLTAIEKQRQHTDAATLAGLITAGLAVAGQQPAGRQLVLQAFSNAQWHGHMQQTMFHLASEQRPQLAHILVEEQQWELAVAASQDDSTLQHILNASAVCQLPPAAVLAVLKAAVAAHNSGVTAAFLHSQVFAQTPQHGSDLISGISDVGLLEPLCKLLLSTTAGKIHGKETAGGATAQAEQQHRWQRSAVLSLLRWVVAGGGLTAGNTWGRLLELYAHSLSAHPEAASRVGSDDQGPLASLLSLYSLAAGRVEPSEAAAWHLQTALQLAAVPGCAPVAAVCLEVRVTGIMSRASGLQGKPGTQCRSEPFCLTSAIVHLSQGCRQGAAMSLLHTDM
jgi:hypothetical protein